MEEAIVRVDGEEEDGCNELGARRRQNLADEREAPLLWQGRRVMQDPSVTLHFPWDSNPSGLMW